MRVLLASASPRRRVLLKKIFSDFDVISPDVDESYRGATVADTVVELARRKGKAVQGDYDVVIAADTVVCLDDRVMGKPADAQQALAMLSALNGRIHRVITGVYLNDHGQEQTFAVTTQVEFFRKTDAQLRAYIAEHHVLDKAGAYAIQDGVMVKGISGSYDNVVGLPTERLKEALGIEEVQ